MNRKEINEDRRRDFHSFRLKEKEKKTCVQR
jgi:hypothetical protein